MDIKKIINIWLFVVLISSCHNKLYFQEHVTTDGLWHKDSVKQLSFNISNTEQLYELSFLLKTNSDYPYRNIHFFTEVVDSDSISVLDTISFSVADLRGKRLGKGKGNIKSYKIPLTMGSFRKKGQYYFNITQGMREVFLNGTICLGLSIKEVNE